MYLTSNISKYNLGLKRIVVARKYCNILFISNRYSVNITFISDLEAEAMCGFVIKDFEKMRGSEMLSLLDFVYNEFKNM